MSRSLCRSASVHLGQDLRHEKAPLSCAAALGPRLDCGSSYHAAMPPRFDAPTPAITAVTWPVSHSCIHRPLVEALQAFLRRLPRLAPTPLLRGNASERNIECSQSCSERSPTHEGNSTEHRPSLKGWKPVAAQGVVAATWTRTCMAADGACRLACCARALGSRHRYRQNLAVLRACRIAAHVPRLMIGAWRGHPEFQRPGDLCRMPRGVLPVLAPGSNRPAPALCRHRSPEWWMRTAMQSLWRTASTWSTSRQAACCPLAYACSSACGDAAEAGCPGSAAHGPPRLAQNRAHWLARRTLSARHVPAPVCPPTSPSLF